MPSIISTLRTLVIVTTTLGTFVLGDNVSPNAPNQRGLSIFYKIRPSDAVIYAYAHGDFEHLPLPSTAYECGPDPSFPFDPPSFGCPNRAIHTTGPSIAPTAIWDAGTRDPTCLSLGVAFEHLQWATWTHACWRLPVPALDTPDGHAEAAFQSQALRYRRAVLWQHDSHLRTLNRAIADLRLAADAELAAMRAVMDRDVETVCASYAAEMKKRPDEDHERLLEEQNAKTKAIRDGAEKGLKLREQKFWVDSWGHRWKTVEIDHLVGDYFEWYIRGWETDKLDWAGMGQPDPKFPPEQH